MLTINNPRVDIHQWLERARAVGASSARCQSERGESGTLHLQCFISWSSQKAFGAVKKVWPDAHIEKARNAFHSWQYCGKHDTRLEGPVEFGIMPLPQKQTSGDTAAFNKAVLEEGPEAMVSDGRLSIREYAKIKGSVNLFRLT